MNRTKNIGPFRVTPDEEKIISQAVDKSGVQLATKARELLLAWARKILK
jgi:hypothetical protein